MRCKSPTVNGTRFEVTREKPLSVNVHFLMDGVQVRPLVFTICDGDGYRVWEKKMRPPLPVWCTFSQWHLSPRSPKECQECARLSRSFVAPRCHRLRTVPQCSCGENIHVN